ncbi:SDR family oxidoreductase [Haliangium ochraceum]|uniref:NmrA family protein n=1 Tax=Haliangium ochraceum (strain DSM 14365 / JCM 11303 / SMP-2) TaxID=502025 RepID=D0LR34_HALO1|nr:SDR family oxidoreductase [Haliangium ochraceum]ACY15542.1 NmrA family protein [Haliangium ochraceum DSM 14365]
MNTIAITGSTGQLGRLVIDKIKNAGRGDDLIALARTPENAADLGVSVRAADYDRPETLGPALAGVDTLLLISASEVGKRVPQHQNIIDAAKAAGVGHIVYTSVLHADTSSIGLADEHRATEAALAASGVPYTLLRNGWYTENYGGGIASALEHGALVGSAGEGKISAAPRADYAEAAVAVLLSEELRGTTYELAGDSSFTLAELAAEISRQTGREIPYQNLPAEKYGEILTQAGVPAGFAQAIAGWDLATAEGALFDDGRQLSQLIGRPTTPLADVVATTL